MLYRYDMSKPPEKWSTDYKCYYYPLPWKEHAKNMIGAFFFYETYDQALITGKTCALTSNINEFWITKTSLAHKVRLLDISYAKFLDLHGNGSSCLLLLELLKHGVDVFTDDFTFFNYGAPAKRFSEIRPQAMRYFELQCKRKRTLDDSTDLVQCGSAILEFFGTPSRHFAALLTDFNNGKVFKELLLSLGYDGYIFNEEPSGVRTFCIFDSYFLAPPECKSVRMSQW